jgi:hypothetical protein
MNEKEIRSILRDALAELDRRAVKVVKKVVIPAALGASLALSGGCGTRAAPPSGQDSTAVTSDGQPKKMLDGGLPAPLYAAVQPDALQPKPDMRMTPPPQPDYAAPMYGSPFPIPKQDSGA